MTASLSALLNAQELPPQQPALAVPAQVSFVRDPGAIAKNAAGEMTVRSGYINFQNTPMERVLEVYADVSGRRLLSNLFVPPVRVTLTAANELTVAQVREAVESLLSLNGINLVLIGDKHFTVVRSTYGCEGPDRDWYSPLGRLLEQMDSQNKR